MGTYLRDEAIILAVRPYREADAWVSCWTKYHGKHEAFAAGLRKIHAKQRGHMQPFARVEIMLAEGKQFERLVVGRMTEFHAAYIRAHSSWLQIASSLARLCDTIATPEVAGDTTIFDLFLEVHRLAAFYQQPFSPARSRLLEALFLDRLAGDLGYGISLEQCVRCQKADISLSGFSLQEGGFFCESCEKQVYGARSLTFSTPSDELRRLAHFLRTHPVEQALHVSAPQSHFLDVAHLLEAMLEVLPVSRSPMSKTSLVQV